MAEVTQPLRSALPIATRRELMGSRRARSGTETYLPTSQHPQHISPISFSRFTPPQLPFLIHRIDHRHPHSPIP